MQIWGLQKLMGLDFSIEYKKGKDNLVADALLKVRHNASIAAILHFSPHLMTEAIGSWKAYSKLQKLVDKIRLTQQPHKLFTFDGMLLKRKGKVVIGAQQDLRNKILSHFHGSPIGGHLGIELAYRRIKEQFYWKGLQREVKKWIREYTTCQRFKSIIQLPAGFLQPLSIPDRAWKSISMDFIIGLPKSDGMSVILVM